ncbi:MAG TPA: FAD-dependent oxidoreductase [Bryobacteraceae bacterium]|nr:FAD-dependent oxidoreductase [Bryobacteraceae bacterium]
MTEVCVLGGGPAGSSAALAALRCGARVAIVERSRFPRHKVCGEFLSPGIEPALGQLGLWASFAALKPARIHRMAIHVGGAQKTAPLPEPAFGLSRHAFDHLLWTSAMAAGAVAASEGAANIVTTGRSSPSVRGGRLFGFKAHFRGPTDDAVELYFSRNTYVGVNCVEAYLTNVCGLAPEEELKAVNFEMDAFIRRDPALRARLAPLTRAWDWIFTGPLEFGQRFESQTNTYPAGDALSFVDPFTGSGLLCAVLTGTLAGECAAGNIPVPEYLRRCAASIRQPYRFSSILRWIATTRAAAPLLRAAPAGLIFRCTRPSSMLVH